MCHRIGFPLQTMANNGQKYVPLAGNRNLSIHFQSFIELFSTTVDFVDSRSILNVSLCDIKSLVLANLYYFETMSTWDMRGNNFYGPLPDFNEHFSLLTYFDVSANNLTGSFRPGIQNLVSLQNLDFSKNPFMREGNSASIHLPVSINQTFQERYGHPKQRTTRALKDYSSSITIAFA